MQLSKVTPVLRSFDEVIAKAFYVEFLGFAVDWQHRFESNFPLYMQLSRDECVLHLSEHHGDCCPGAAQRLQIDDVDAYCSELLVKNHINSKPVVENMPWGTRDMQIIDPFGNRLVFTSQVST
jgi:uncharacterized glyoxalase superfamily protein PhnB